MATNVLMPKLGLTMETGTVVAWLKSVGDSVSAGEPLVEIETDKIANTVESPSAGRLSSILVKEGEEAPILAVIGVIE